MEYGEELMEPELRPEFIAKIKEIEKEGYGKTYNSLEELEKNLKSK